MFLECSRIFLFMLYDSDIMLYVMYLLLLQGPYHLPETFIWDAKRLSQIRHAIDALAIASTMLVTVRHFLLSQKVRLTGEQEIDFQTR